jgi:predicted nucleotidyltransferase
MAEHQARLQKERGERIEVLQNKALVEIELLVRKMITIDPGIEKIILFGSLATGAVTSPDFDIDLAVQCAKENSSSCYAAHLIRPSRSILLIWPMLTYEFVNPLTH